jgi:hypothetical protein
LVEKAHGRAIARVVELLELAKLTAKDVEEVMLTLQSARRRAKVIRRQVEVEAAGKMIRGVKPMCNVARTLPFHHNLLNYT